MAIICCRFCGHGLNHEFVDLGVSPLSNSFLRSDQLNQMEPFYPLRTFVCEKCFLVQLEMFQSPDKIFSDYAYFSSFSESWLQHVEQYTRMAIERFALGKTSLVVEVASNDGYLLNFFMQQGLAVLGVEPARNVAAMAQAKGIPTLVRFFGVQIACELVQQGRLADLLVANNVLAHVPDLNDFVAGLKLILKPMGTITLEFPHLFRMIAGGQFDTVYHEHFSYFSFLTAQRVFERHGLTLYDVEELHTHGGSLRVFAAHADDTSKTRSSRVADLSRWERSLGCERIETYGTFHEKVRTVKRDLLKFLIKAREDGQRVVGYGAPAKGNTLLNYCGIRSDLLDFTVDISPHKQGLFLPGTHIPIYAPEKIYAVQPDYVLILPWNIRREIMEQLHGIREWGGRFVIPIPKVEIV